MRNLTNHFSSKLAIPLLVLLAISLFGRPAEAQYGGGTGEPNDPYMIYTSEQMNAIGLHEEDWDKHFRLMANIDLAAYTGTDFNIIGYWVDWRSPDNKPFTGVFDGSGHTISNFNYTSIDANGVGLFGYVNDPNTELKNLGLIDPNIDAGIGRHIGSLVGIGNATITNCYAEDGSVSGGWSVGGLVGRSEGTIINCYSTGTVSGYNWVGGLVGESGGTIINCYSNSSVEGEGAIGGLVGINWGVVTQCNSTRTVSGSSSVGGLVGTNMMGTIIYCYSTSAVSGTGLGGGIGGLVGNQNGALTHCYSMGAVTGGYIVGGLVGDNGGYVTHCYSTGAVRGSSNVGGLVGNTSFGSISKSFWDSQTSGRINMCGHSTGGERGEGCDNTGGRTTGEMQDSKTFMEAGWDFVGEADGPSDIWTVPGGGGYPILWWQLSPLPDLPTFSGGTGLREDPYLISTANELNSIGNNPRLMAAHFKLINDIDLIGFDFYTIGDGYVSPFTGVFDGNGYTISNLTCTSIDPDHIGLFGDVHGVVKDVGLIRPNVDTESGFGCGPLARFVEGTIANCYAEDGSISGDEFVGGLVGRSEGTIINCYSTGTVSGYNCVGGLVGENFGGTITNCYSMGSVSGGWSVGGLVGDNHDGGLVGALNKGTITNCYSTGRVSGDGDSTIGGLVGYNGGEVWASFWDIEGSSITNMCGRQGDDATGCDDSYGKSTAEMQTESTFTDAGWDFVDETTNGTEDIWWILEGQDYPRLWWELIPEN
ncbi:MAG: GLUG motif-containing protein [Planctomycetota bacterium]|jgi:hypothetical protein